MLGKFAGLPEDQSSTYNGAVHVSAGAANKKPSGLDRRQSWSRHGRNGCDLGAGVERRGECSPHHALHLAGREQGARSSAG